MTPTEEMRRNRDALAEECYAHREKIDDLRAENERLQAINDQLQAANDQLKAANDQLEREGGYNLRITIEQLAIAKHDLRAMMDERNSVQGNLDAAQHDLQETRKALDEARAHVAQPQAVTRRDLYICSALSGWMANPEGGSFSDANVIDTALRIMVAAADGRKQ
jgi:predicted  nucleic acid-binding Zn-ribbon protein